MKLIQNSTDFDEIIVTNNLVLVDFFADWCEPCKWLDVILENLEKRIGNNALIVKIDTENHPNLTQKFTIKSVPVLAIFQNGKHVWRMNGFGTENELLGILSQFFT